MLPEDDEVGAVGEHAVHPPPAQPSLLLLVDDGDRISVDDDLSRIFIPLHEQEEARDHTDDRQHRDGPGEGQFSGQAQGAGRVPDPIEQPGDDRPDDEGGE